MPKCHKTTDALKCCICSIKLSHQQQPFLLNCFFINNATQENWSKTRNSHNKQTQTTSKQKKFQEHCDDVCRPYSVWPNCVWWEAPFSWVHSCQLLLLPLSCYLAPAAHCLHPAGAKAGGKVLSTTTQWLHPHAHSHWCTPHHPLSSSLLDASCKYQTDLASS